MFDRKRKTPVELWTIAQIGSDAATARRVLRPMFEEEKSYIMTQLAQGGPDKSLYDRLSGRAELILQLETLLEMREAEGDHARTALTQQQTKEG